MSPHEIRPKQLRVLLVLLVLVPLIPTALMIRYMVDALKGERIDATERIHERYTQLLDSALRSAPSANGAPNEQANWLYNHLREFTEPNASVRILDSSGRLLAGEEAPWGQPVAKAPIPGSIHGTAQIFLSGPGEIDEAVSGQYTVFVWTGVLVTLAVLLIAGTAAMAVSRQIDLRDLKSTSVATVAHEMRTPLASMLMLVDTLREGRYRSEEQLREYLDLIAKENERLKRIGENFLTFSRVERKGHTLNLVPVSPAEVATQAIAPLRKKLDSPDCSFSMDVPESLPEILADRDSLAQVLANLVENAIKYSGETKKISVKACADAAFVIFTVEDNGIGIAAGQKRRIFEPFYQVDQKLSRTREGAGLGLAIVQRIVKAHDGQITVASEPGKGSVFTVKIPLV